VNSGLGKRANKQRRVCLKAAPECVTSAGGPELGDDLAKDTGIGHHVPIKLEDGTPVEGGPLSIQQIRSQ
jgi:hypothetical protein